MFGDDKKFNKSAMLGLKLIHVSKRGPGASWYLGELLGIACSRVEMQQLLDIFKHTLSNLYILVIISKYFWHLKYGSYSGSDVGFIDEHTQWCRKVLTTFVQKEECTPRTILSV